ncbi:hypothetical protein U9M48_032257 [Paspalum notatum var. saurae]|uniref:TF-B3 domain-containing protein n=1 Tax=Paspalum notatum var. saurae TaxID=547442 RepID=A0AAQ3U548_PASNO
MASDSSTPDLEAPPQPCRVVAVLSKDKSVADSSSPGHGGGRDATDPPSMSAAAPCAAETSRVQLQQPGVLPLLGKPYFSCVLCKSHVHQPFQVVVPRSLAPFLPATTVPAAVTRRGRRWGMRFTGGRQIQRLEAGWRAFAVDNGLRLGDGCVFELVDGRPEGVVFRVQVLRADIPPAIRERAGGYTSSCPIVID